MYLLMSHSNQEAVPSILFFLRLLSLLRKPSAGAKRMDQIFVLVLLPVPPGCPAEEEKDRTMARGWEINPVQIALHMSAVGKSEEW